MKNRDLLINCLLFLLPFSIDRLTKHLAMTGFFNKYNSSFISLNILINRGISLGLFDSESRYVFLLISSMVSVILIVLLAHIKTKLTSGNNAIGEILVLSGAFSNFIDRFLHNGVIDFLILPISKFSWPGVFNFADVFILLGILVIVLTNFK